MTLHCHTYTLSNVCALSGTVGRPVHVVGAAWCCTAQRRCCAPKHLWYDVIIYLFLFSASCRSLVLASPFQIFIPIVASAVIPSLNTWSIATYYSTSLLSNLGPFTLNKVLTRLLDLSEIETKINFSENFNEMFFESYELAFIWMDHSLYRYCKRKMLVHSEQDEFKNLDFIHIWFFLTTRVVLTSLIQWYKTSFKPREKEISYYFQF